MASSCLKKHTPGSHIEIKRQGQFVLSPLWVSLKLISPDPPLYTLDALRRSSLDRSGTSTLRKIRTPEKFLAGIFSSLRRTNNHFLSANWTAWIRIYNLEVPWFIRRNRQTFQ